MHLWYGRVVVQPIQNYPTYYNHPTMPQITLSVPQEKLPVLQEFLQVLGIERHNISSFFGKKKQTITRNTQESKVPFTWEYYSNELEFE